MDSPTPLELAIDIVGTASALARGLGISKGAVSQWKDEGRRVPAEYCPAIELLTHRAVTCEMLRPDIGWAYLRAPHVSDRASRRRPATTTQD